MLANAGRGISLFEFEKISPHYSPLQGTIDPVQAENTKLVYWTARSPVTVERPQPLSFG